MNNLDNRYATPDEIKETGFWNLQIVNPGLKDSDAQAIRRLFILQRARGRTIDLLYTDTAFTQATVGKRSSSDLLGMLAL